VIPFIAGWEPSQGSPANSYYLLSEFLDRNMKDW